MPVTCQGAEGFPTGNMTVLTEGTYQSRGKKDVSFQTEPEQGGLQNPAPHTTLPSRNY